MLLLRELLHLINPEYYRIPILGKLTLPESDDLPLYPMHSNLQLTHIMYEMTESRFSFYAANPLSLFLEGFSSESLWALVF